ncbi:hypothetical protein F5887DRAFT_963955, partial [Amanita rubescens]
SIHFLSSSHALLPLLARIAAQSQCKPRKDLSHSLRFYLIIIFTLNFPSLWFHSTRSPNDDRALILDFVGLAYIPSRLLLLSLDAFIILLQSLLATIAYETALSQNSSEHDILRPLESKDSHSNYVIDLRFQPFLSRLRNPPPIRQTSSLPLPNSTPWTIPTGMGLALLRAGTRIRTDRRLPGTLDTNT